MTTPSKWKHRVLLAVLPIAAVTVGCLAAQDDPNALLDAELQPRSWAGGQLVRVKLVGSAGRPILQPDLAEDMVYVAEAAREVAKGGLGLDDVILPAMYEQPIAVRMAILEDGSTDACTIDVPEGSEVLGELSIQLQVTTNTELGGLSVLNRVEGAEACEGDGFFFQESELGELGQISMCPASCDTVDAAEELGASVMVDIVIADG
ncbi:MAG: hypothetical protein AB1Z98_26170 [Nannocystaceae bacterium]